MTAMVRMMLLALPAASAEAEILKIIAIFCGIGLLMSPCVASHGLDRNRQQRRCLTRPAQKGDGGKAATPSIEFSAALNPGTATETRASTATVPVSILT
jgi:hypothetical protein